MLSQLALIGAIVCEQICANDVRAFDPDPGALLEKLGCLGSA